MMPTYVCRVPKPTVAVLRAHCPIHLNMMLAEAASEAQDSILLSLICPLEIPAGALCRSDPSHARGMHSPVPLLLVKRSFETGSCTAL